MPRKGSTATPATSENTDSATAPVTVPETIPETAPATTDQTPADDATSGRQGRPRPQLTLERDKAVADKLAEYALDQEWTKNEVAEAVGLDVSIVYHCLNRLSWAGVVTKVGRGKFIRTAGENGQPVPYSSEYTQKPEKTARATASEAPVTEPEAAVQA